MYLLGNKTAWIVICCWMIVVLIWALFSTWLNIPIDIIRLEYNLFYELSKIFTSCNICIIIIKLIKVTKTKIIFKERNIWNDMVVLTLYLMQFYGNQHAACNYIPLKSSITRNNCHTRLFFCHEESWARNKNILSLKFIESIQKTGSKYI